MQHLPEDPVAFPLAAKGRCRQVPDGQLLGQMGVDVEHHRLDFLAGWVWDRNRCRGRMHLLHQPQPEGGKRRLQPQFVAKGGFVQRKTLPQQPERLGLHGVLRRKLDELQPRRIPQRSDVLLLHRAAGDARHQLRLEQMQHTLGAALHGLGLVEDIAVHQPPAACPEQPLPARCLVDEGPALHIEQLHALVPVPRGAPPGEVVQRRAAAQVGELGRKAWQPLLLAARIKVHGRNFQHPASSCSTCCAMIRINSAAFPVNPLTPLLFLSRRCGIL